MKKSVGLVLLSIWSASAGASWYWPFGSDDSEPEPPRLSELMEPASLLIDEASDLAAEGKSQEAIENYRKALAELDRIEAENPERAAQPEFATLRNKRAYVNATIDSMLMHEVQSNAKVVAVSDTTELEKKLAAERQGKKQVKEAEKAEERKPQAEKKQAEVEEKKAEKVEEKKAVTEPLTPREQAMADIASGDYAAAELVIQSMLVAKPNGAMALNLKAALETAQGKYREAEATLDQAIMSNPRNYFAYYNMANLILKTHPENRAAARRYYETGRTFGGPADENLEALVK